MANVVVIGCSPSDILSACQNTITSLAIGGRTVYAVIARSDESESASYSSTLSPEAANISQLTAIGINKTFPIDSFDFSAITQANADAVNSVIKNVKPTLVIIPSWKSPNHKRKILARTSLIACRGIGTILMYELDLNNTSFNPNIIFEASVDRSLVQKQRAKNNNDSQENPRATITNQDGIDDAESFENKSMLQHNGMKATNSYERMQEQFESHRTLLLEESGLF
jgi:hypothetical protein